jgi:hypothetical protein
VHADSQSEVLVNPWTATDVMRILETQAWAPPASDELVARWCEHAAMLLGPQAGGEDSLRGFLGLIFGYNAAELIRQAGNHAVMARSGARDVIRELANRVLDMAELDSDTYKVIIDEMKAKLPCRGRELFFPIRLALAGRAGEGELDRVILLLDSAAKLPFAKPVKGARQRMLEFCAALD